MFLYATENFLAGIDAAISSSSEDGLYVRENLYCQRPSKPFRFTGIGAAGAPEWICVEFDAPKRVTLAAIFNHNLVLAGSADELTLKGCDAGCGSGGCDWDIPDYELPLAGRIVAGWNDLYQTLDQTRLAYRVDFIDAANPSAYVEVGELFLAEYTALSNARLRPGRMESPQLWRQKNVTFYGQHWPESLSRSTTLSVEISSGNDPDQVDAVRAMVDAIHDAGGRAVIIPNDRHRFAYYAFLASDSGMAAQMIRGIDCEFVGWRLDFECLTRGIALPS